MASDKEKASRRNQNPNYEGLVDMRSCRAKGTGTKPKRYEKL